MANFVVTGCNLLWKAFDKSEYKDGKYNPNFNLGWLAPILTVGVFILTTCIRVKNSLGFTILYTLLSMLSVVFIYIIIFTIKAYRIDQREKISIQQKIEYFEQEIKDLKEKTEKQAHIIDILKNEQGYGDAFRELYIAFSLLNLYFYEKRNTNEKPINEITDEIKDILKSFCNCLSLIYSKKTGAKCSTSIKLIEENFEKNRLESNVKNLERDSSSGDRDLDKNYSDHEHKVSDNTCFLEIAKDFLNSEEDSLYYINNSLSTDVSYKTSSIDCRVKMLNRLEKKKLKNGLKNHIERPQIWNQHIKYKSEIVVPLLLAQNPFNSNMLGFLTIDCEVSNAFNEEYDIPLIKGVADGIYEIITDFRLLV